MENRKTGKKKSMKMEEHKTYKFLEFEIIGCMISIYIKILFK